MLHYSASYNYQYTSIWESKYEWQKRLYRAGQAINQSISTKPTEIRRQKIFLQGSLVAGKLVPVVAIHPLGGSRANRHHTPNPQSGAAQPTQDRDPQATSNPLEYLLVLHREKVKNHSQSPWSEPKTITFLCSTILAAPSRLGGDNHQE